MQSHHPDLGRRSALALGLAWSLASRPARAAPLTVTHASGRTVVLKGLAERIVLGSYYEELTAIAGPAGWDRDAGFGKSRWSDWRPATYRRSLVPIPRLPALPEVGNTDDGDFSMETVPSLRPDLVVLSVFSFNALSSQV